MNIFQKAILRSKMKYHGRMAYRFFLQSNRIEYSMLVDGYSYAKFKRYWKLNEKAWSHSVKMTDVKAKIVS